MTGCISIPGFSSRSLNRAIKARRLYLKGVYFFAIQKLYFYNSLFRQNNLNDDEVKRRMYGKICICRRSCFGYQIQ